MEAGITTEFEETDFAGISISCRRSLNGTIRRS